MFLIATPIGNLDDMTFRAVAVLKQCDMVFAEDTRHSRILFQHFAIDVPLRSYHAFNEHGRTREVLALVKSGAKAGLITDAGTPGIADPGFLLVREAVKAGIAPQIIPGVSALTFAVAAAGVPADRFAFYGFLPVKSGRRAARLDEIAAENKSVVIYESPRRMAKLINELQEKLGDDAPCAIIREATKLHEEVLRGTLGELTEQTKNRVWKGECALVVQPAALEYYKDAREK